jgi:hypothetical protein
MVNMRKVFFKKNVFFPTKKIDYKMERSAEDVNVECKEEAEMYISVNRHPPL